ncbi:MAG: phosphoenolpyruvate kinase [Myxococcales bacterium]|nr:phosphoenolpyruvate kinase [Myxococcales bacterium]
MSPSSLTVSLSSKKVGAILEHLAEVQRVPTPDVLPPFCQVLYGGAHLFHAGLPAKAGRIALAALDGWGRDAASFGACLGVTDRALAEEIWTKVRARLETRPLDAMCADFEDGFGLRSDAEEDAEALRVARELSLHVLAAAASPATTPRVGVRIRALAGLSARRAARTLDLVLTAMLEQTGGVVPRGLTVTLPKVTHPAQVTALVEMLTMIEDARNITRGAIGVEILVETPRALWDETGLVLVPALVAAAAGRCGAAHLGAYDLSSSLGVPMSAQRLDHPLCDLARAIMVATLEGTGAVAVDGVTTALPLPRHKEGDRTLSDMEQEENLRAVRDAWTLHAHHVTHALEHGVHAGWDIHPAQLPARYGALFAHYLTHRAEVTTRLARFLEAATRAVRTGQDFDDAATAEGALTFLVRGLACGALDHADVARAGLTPEELAWRSFARVIAGRVALGRPSPPT